MRKLVSLVFVFSIAMLFVLAVPRAFAKAGGSVALDNDSTCEVHRQNKTFCTVGFVWLNTSSEQLAGCEFSCIVACNDASAPICAMDDAATNSCPSSNGNKTQWKAYAFTYSPPTDGSVCSFTAIATSCTDPNEDGTVGGDGFKHGC